MGRRKRLGEKIETGKRKGKQVFEIGDIISEWTMGRWEKYSWEEKGVNREETMGRELVVSEVEIEIVRRRYFECREVGENE
ncbi:hypothetical protein ACF0H5_023411 [Mactra antiquata]